MLRLSTAFAGFAFAAFCAACTNPVAGDVPVVVDDSAEDEAAVTYVEPGEVDSTRVYLGVDNPADISLDVPVFYGHFDMLPRGKVDITVTRAPEGVDESVGFKVYRVNPRGTLRYLGEVSGTQSITARVESRAGGTFVVEAVAGLNVFNAAHMTIKVECKRRDGQCAVNGQPGAFCGGRGGHPCDGGLFCQIDNNCGRSDASGICTIPTTICPTVACRTVCGCDGNDYCDACNAHAVGANVDHEGSCAPEACDATVYDRAENVNVHGIWTTKATTDGFDITATLSLNDGDFAYEQFWDPTCLHVAPFCRRPSLMFRETGGWQVNGSTVQLMPDPESTPAPEQLAQAFGIRMNCEGDVQLATTELGVDRTFTRDLCADFSCNTEEGWRCEVQQVQCFAAPCPPQPTCVHD